MTQQWVVACQVAFYPTAGGGKLHAAHKVSRTAVCGVAAALEATAWVTTAQGTLSTAVHPMVCRRCLRLTTHAGFTGTGYEQ